MPSSFLPSFLNLLAACHPWSGAGHAAEGCGNPAEFYWLPGRHPRLYENRFFSRVVQYTKHPFKKQQKVTATFCNPKMVNLHALTWKQVSMFRIMLLLIITGTIKCYKNHEVKETKMWKEGYVRILVPSMRTTEMHKWDQSPYLLALSLEVKVNTLK